MLSKNSIFRHKRNHRRRKSRRAASRWFSPALEWLEPRQMLAGNVTAAVNGGDLILTGDADSNSVQVSVVAGDLVVQGFDNTTINGGVEPFVAFAGSTTVTDDFFANLGAGDDVLTVDGITITNRASVAAEAGDDRIGFANADIGTDLRILTAHGADMVNLESVITGRDAIIDTSEQRDTVRITDSEIDRDLSVRMGRYKDVLVLDNVTVRDDVGINSGNGPDDVVLIDTDITGRLNVNLQLGDDFLYIDPSTVGGASSVRGGNGNDMVVVEGANALDSLNMRLGRGSDAGKIDPATMFNRAVAARNMEANDVSDEDRDTQLMHPTDGALTKSRAAEIFFHNIDNTAPTTIGIDVQPVSQNAPDTVIDLNDAFDDAEDDELLAFSVVRNTNPELVTATIDNVAGTLTLSYAQDTVGAAKFTVRAEDLGGQTVDARFDVQVVTLGADFTSKNVTVESNDGLLITNDPNFTIDVTTDPGATVEVDIDGDGFDDGTATADSAGNATLNVMLVHNDANNGLNTLEIQARADGTIVEIAQQDVHLAEGTVVRFNTTLGSYDVELLDADAPNTVGVFLDDLARYNDSFVHRTVSGFIVQGGGFSFDPFTETIVDVVDFPAPPNEFADASPPNSNVRGTLSTAQVGGNINSFTGQWFVNTVNNDGSGPTNSLDAVPHTVFGRVIGTGMDVVDTIEAVPTFNLVNVLPNSSAMGEVPLRDYTPVHDEPISGTVSTGITSLDGNGNPIQEVLGTGTSFRDELAVGQELHINGEVRTIININSTMEQLFVQGEFTDVTDATAQVNSAVPDDGDFIKTTSLTKLFDPLGTENTFRVLENAANDTPVGEVTTSDGLVDPIFEFVDPTLAAELNLAADDHFSGPFDADVVLIDYSDYG